MLCVNVCGEQPEEKRKVTLCALSLDNNARVHAQRAHLHPQHQFSTHIFLHPEVVLHCSSHSQQANTNNNDTGAHRSMVAIKASADAREEPCHKKQPASNPAPAAWNTTRHLCQNTHCPTPAVPHTCCLCLPAAVNELWFITCHTGHNTSTA
eukprot:1158789-Pelagomonas_calceolata.AAC.3